MHCDGRYRIAEISPGYSTLHRLRNRIWGSFKKRSSSCCSGSSGSGGGGSSSGGGGGGGGSSSGSSSLIEFGSSGCGSSSSTSSSGTSHIGADGEIVSDSNCNIILASMSLTCRREVLNDDSEQSRLPWK